jgi:ribonuclease P protein subunit POP4
VLGMRVTPDNIEFHELIGLDTRIIKTSNPSLKRISGRVIDETKNTLKILSWGLTKIIPKNSSFFIFKLPDGTRVKIHGSLLLGKPENRINKMKR